MQYKYIATNNEGKRLSGSINAPDEHAARSQLNNLGFSILEIKETQEAAPESGMQKYEFESIDKAGKKIKGTIPAQNPTLAYKRLVEEYGFTVHYLAPENATPQEKEALRQGGLQALTNAYEVGQHQHDKQKENMQSIVESPEFIAEKKVLIDQVDQIIGRLQKLLTDFEGKISPEKRAAIMGYIDKLLRIKSSNNLEYIGNTCKELIEKMQSEEMFLESSVHEKERKTVLLESQRMMLQLNKAIATKKSVGLQMKNLFGSLEQKLRGSKFEFLLIPFLGMNPNPQMVALKTQLKVLRSQKWDAIKIALKTPKEARAEAWEQVKQIKSEEKILKEKLKGLKHLRDEKNLLIKRERHVYFIEEISTFTGWLLGFYLIYYFLGHYVVTKNLEISPFLGIPFELEDSVLFKYLLSIIFLIHVAASVKINFFLRNRLINPILVTVTALLSLLVLFNF